MGLEFKAGDIVALKSGGPHLAIESVPDCEWSKVIAVECVWYDDAAHFCRQQIAVHLLKLIYREEDQPFGIPEALVAAKDAEAEALKAERERQWAEDQVRYAHTTGYVVDPGIEPRVTPDDHG